MYTYEISRTSHIFRQRVIVAYVEVMSGGFTLQDKQVALGHKNIGDEIWSLYKKFGRYQCNN